MARILAFSVLFLAWTSHAQTAPELVDGSALRETTITVKVSGKTSAKDIFCMEKTPGASKARGTQYLFTPYSYTVKQLKKKNASASKLALYGQLSKVGKKTCTQLSENPPGTSTPLPSPTSTPVPGITPVVGNFDQFGNVTEKGKALFEIPSDLEANVERGKRIQLIYCTGCHVERVGYTFSSVDTNIRKSPMLYDDEQIPRNQRADLVAYLNRFRP